MTLDDSLTQPEAPTLTFEEILKNAAIGIDQQQYRLPDLEPVLELLDQAITSPLSEEQINELRWFHGIAVQLCESPVEAVSPDDPDSVAAMVAWIENKHELLYRLNWGKDIPYHEAEPATRFLYIWHRMMCDSPSK